MGTLPPKTSTIDAAADMKTSPPSTGANTDAGSGSDASPVVDAASADVAADASDGASSGDALGPPSTGPTPLGPASFSANVRVDDATGTSNQAEVTMAARPDGLVLEGWIDERSGQRCGYSVSTDGGKTWGTNFFVGTTVPGGFVGDPGVAIDQAGNLYIVCEDYGTGQGTNSVGILFSMSSDSGMT